MTFDDPELWASRIDAVPWKFDTVWFIGWLALMGAIGATEWVGV